MKLFEGKFISFDDFCKLDESSTVHDAIMRRERANNKVKYNISDEENRRYFPTGNLNFDDFHKILQVGDIVATAQIENIRDSKNRKSIGRMFFNDSLDIWYRFYDLNGYTFDDLLDSLDKVEGEPSKTDYEVNCISSIRVFIDGNKNDLINASVELFNYAPDEKGNMHLSANIDNRLTDDNRILDRVVKHENFMDFIKKMKNQYSKTNRARIETVLAPLDGDMLAEMIRDSDNSSYPIKHTGYLILAGNLQYQQDIDEEKDQNLIKGKGKVSKEDVKKAEDINSKKKKKEESKISDEKLEYNERTGMFDEVKKNNNDTYLEYDKIMGQWNEFKDIVEDDQLSLFDYALDPKIIKKFYIRVCDFIDNNKEWMNNSYHDYAAENLYDIKSKMEKSSFVKMSL